MTTNSETTVLDHENYWVREIAHIMNEMLHAIEQRENPELNTAQRLGYDKRAIYLNQKAIFCINNAYNDSNKEETDENE